MEASVKPDVLHLMVRLPPTKPYEKISINDISIETLNLKDLVICKVSLFFFEIINLKIFKFQDIQSH